MTFEDEVRVCFERLQESLGKLGATMAHVVKLQTYLTDLAPYAAFSGVPGELFSAEPTRQHGGAGGGSAAQRADRDGCARLPAGHGRMTAAARRRFEERTPRSRELMAQSHRVVAGGVSRNFGYHVPYPVVNRGGKGAWLTDVDGNDYIDFAYGMSVIHGHAYPPIVRAIADATAEAWAWPGHPSIRSPSPNTSLPGCREWNRSASPIPAARR